MKRVDECFGHPTSVQTPRWIMDPSQTRTAMKPHPLNQLPLPEEDCIFVRVQDLLSNFSWCFQCQLNIVTAKPLFVLQPLLCFSPLLRSSGSTSIRFGPCGATSESKASQPRWPTGSAANGMLVTVSVVTSSDGGWGGWYRAQKHTAKNP